MERGFLIIALFMLLNRQAFGQDMISEVDVKPDVFFYLDKKLLDSGGVFTLRDIKFKLGSYELIDSVESLKYEGLGSSFVISNEERLSEISRYMINRPNYIFEIRLHTDCRGSKLSSRRLSLKRAESIVAELIKRGVDKGQLIARGFEDNLPYKENGIALTCDYISNFSRQEQQILHAKNRRIELLVISKDFGLKD